jgi:hypothetical protein
MKSVDVEIVHGNVRSGAPIWDLFEDDKVCRKVDEALVEVQYLDNELYQHIHSDLLQPLLEQVPE